MDGDSSGGAAAAPPRAARVAAAALPGVETLTFLATTDNDLAGLSPADLVDAVITCERLLAHVHARQLSLLAELGVPGRCGDVSGLVAALVDKAGAGRRADGEVDAAEVAEVTADCAVRVAAAEVAAVLDWSPVTAKIRITQARRMQAALPATATALLQGRVDVGRARMITDRTAVLTPAQCGRVERRVLPLARGRSLGQLETIVDREVIAADPAAAENRRLHAIKGRSVGHRPDKDGMGVITALLPAESAVLVFTLIDLIAQAHQGLDGRSIDQRRADAIADIADELLTHGYLDLDGLIARTHPEHPDNTHPGARKNQAGPATTNTAPAEPAPDQRATATPATAEPAPAADVPAEPAPVVPAGLAIAPAETAPARSAATETAVPTTDPAPGPTAGPASGAAPGRRAGRVLTRHGRRPHLNVTGAWSTLAGLDEQPGHLDGHGAITAPLLRAIAASWASVTAIAVDPATGTAQGIGAHTYRPRQALTDQALTVHGCCRAAGCRMPAWRCELDHLHPFNHRDPAAGGPTTLVNQVPECKFHHLLRHHTDWTPHLQPDMSIRWTTNTGHHATSHPRLFTNPGMPTPDPDPEPETACPATASTPRTAGTDAADTTVHTQHAHTDTDTAADTDTDTDNAWNSGRGGTDNHTPGGPVILGPTVTGPTIPVHPAGTHWEEPNTDLEEPDTIPHPGSVDIHTYRALREQTRAHALHRLAGIADLHPHTRAATALDDTEDSRTRHATHTAAAAEKASLTAHLIECQTAADQAADYPHPPPPPRPHALNRPPRPPNPDDGHQIGGSANHDDPPF